MYGYNDFVYECFYVRGSGTYVYEYTASYVLHQRRPDLDLSCLDPHLMPLSFPERVMRGGGRDADNA